MWLHHSLRSCGQSCTSHALWRRSTPRHILLQNVPAPLLWRSDDCFRYRHHYCRHWRWSHLRLFSDDHPRNEGRVLGIGRASHSGQFKYLFTHLTTHRRQRPLQKAQQNSPIVGCPRLTWSLSSCRCCAGDGISSSTSTSAASSARSSSSAKSGSLGAATTKSRAPRRPCRALSALTALRGWRLHLFVTVSDNWKSSSLRKVCNTRVLSVRIKQGHCTCFATRESESCLVKALA